MIVTDDICSVVENEQGFVREALDLLFIEQESIPEECREVPVKIKSYTCSSNGYEYRYKGTKKTRKSGKKTRQKSRSKLRNNNQDETPRIEIKAVILCDACVTTMSGEVGRTAGYKTGKKRGRGSKPKQQTSTDSMIVDMERLPEQYIVRRLAFEVMVEQTYRHHSKQYHGSRKVKTKHRKLYGKFNFKN